VTEPASTTVHLVRHCDVRNPNGVLYGHLPGFPLSTLGVRQAHALGERLAAAGARAIYSSPLERARETASIIASHIPGSEISLADGLIEAEFGRHLQGVPFARVPLGRPLWLVHMIWPGLLPNDEGVHAMAARVRGVVLRAVAEHPGEPSICVSHGDPIQAFWVEADHRHAYALHRLQCAKGGMLVLHYVGGRLDGKQYSPPPKLPATTRPSPPSEQSPA
jgi:broad specificity phosphatase PhoE